MVALLKDRDWAPIDGRVCLVTAFSPNARVDAGTVIGVPGLPYASIQLRCRDRGDLIGFVTHKTDFAALWAAFRHRTQVPGTTLEVNSTSLSQALGEDEEVWVVWTKRNYSAVNRLFARLLPRLIVCVVPRGAFEIESDPSIRPDLAGETRWKAVAPLATWTPLAMR